MTQDEKIVALKSMIGSSDSDSVLSTYIELAGKKIIARAYPYSTEITDVPDQYGYLQIEIAAYLLNKRGAEGQTSHSENGITRQYENADVPDSMMNTIIPFCGVV